MATRARRALISLLALLLVSASGVASKSFAITNNCEYTVWPGILSSAGSPGMDSTGFALAPGESSTMPFFKTACPRAYSYAYDDATSTFTCAGGVSAYAITFCPSTTSVKSAGSNPQAPAGLALINGTMVYQGGDQFAGAAHTPRSSPTQQCRGPRAMT
uniref:Thaumatin-like protein n=1 Tax=Aegilops tauschii TaxID=37682 RepID=M8CCG5_AEGTA